MVFYFKVCVETSGGQINATRLTAIVAREDGSDTIEIRSRIHPNQTWRFRCDLFINGKQWYMNFTEEKLQFFKSNHLIIYRIKIRGKKNV
jgi:hypothetical protein